MAEEQDDSQKTEEPTQRRLDEAFKKGQIVQSREITNFFILLVLALTVSWFAPYMMNKTRLSLTPFLARPHDIAADASGLGPLFIKLIGDSALIILMPVAATVAAAIAAGFIQNGFVFSLDPITPKLEKISPLSGLKKLFSLRSIIELVKGIVKITVIGIIAYLAVAPEMPRMQTLPDTGAPGIVAFLAHLATRMAVGVCIAMFFIAIFDYLYQRFEFMKRMRMSKQELKDEYKQQEGDPKIKQKLKQMRAERARQRMMAAVPGADVVITNPTHFAIALQYDSATMQAPTVIAKGQDLIAFKIREIAIASDVPIVENAPLAQALYKSVEIDEEIPAAHYEAVAKIISYVYQLKGKPVRYGR